MVSHQLRRIQVAGSHESRRGLKLQMWFLMVIFMPVAGSHESRRGLKLFARAGSARAKWSPALTRAGAD